MKRSPEACGKHARRSFSLIELLLVVAVVAVLALAAGSARRESQIRSKISRTQSDMLRVGRALAAYIVDHDQIPMVGTPFADLFPTFLDVQLSDRRYPGRLLTSPVPYLACVPIDHFNTNIVVGSWSTFDSPLSYVVSWAPLGLDRYRGRDGWVNRIRSTGESMADFFPCTDFHAMMESAGPDLLWWDAPGNSGQTDVNPFFYDPTNGVTSRGQLVYLDCGGVMPGK